MMNTHLKSACLALLLGMAGPVAAQGILQYGFDATTGNIAVPVNDDSGALHHGTNLLWGAAPTYSADIPTAGTAPGKSRNVTGIGSVDFSSTSACISTANSPNVGSGQGIVTAAQIVAAGGLTMEVWVKNPGAGLADTNCFALNLGGSYALGIRNGSLGFYGHTPADLSSLSTNAFTAGNWNHIAAVLSGPNATATSFTSISFYLNGTLAASLSNVAYNAPLSRAASVGNHQYGDWANFNGLVYEPRVTLGALTPQQFTVVEPAGSLTAPGLVEDSTNGEVLSIPVKVSNSSATAYHVTGISFTGAAAANFGNDGNVVPLEIPANGTADVFVKFTPGAGSLAVATLTLATDDPNAATLDVDLSIEVRDPEILIASSYDFGTFGVLPSPTMQEIPVENLGLTHNLVLSNPQLAGAGAAAYSVTLPGPIADAAMLEVTFTPTDAGSYPAVLTLTTNDPYHPTVTVNLAGAVVVSGAPILQYGFDATTGNVAVPVNDDSGAVHHGTNLLFGAAPPYSADIPTAGPAVGQARNVTGVGSVDFTTTTACISTANSGGVGSGQGIVTAADIFAAGGLTMEVWVKNPGGAAGVDSFALNLGGYAALGIRDGTLKFFGHTTASIPTALGTNAFTAGNWNHIAAVLSGPNATATSYSTISFYLNGSLVGSAPNVGFNSFLSRAASVGNHQYNNWADFNGLVYEPRVTIGALTPSQFTVVEPPGSLTAPELVADSTNGEVLPLAVRVRNSSTTVYHVTGISFAGAAAANFGDDGNVFPLEVPANGIADVFVVFTPGAGSLAVATLTLATDDPNAPTLDVDLSIEVRDPEIVIAASYNFGSFGVLPGPTMREIPVENLGLTHNLVLSNPQLTGAGAAAYSVSLPGPITDAAMLEVTFTPTAAGSYPAVLTLTTNDPYHPTVTVNLAGAVAGGGTPVLQWGFDATSGDVAVPVIDDSGVVIHDGTDLLFGAAPVYSADVPAANRTQNVTGIGSVDFSGTNAGISTAASIGVGSGQAIITATDVFNAGGLTMEVWVKSPSSTDDIGCAIGIGGMYVLGERGGRIGFIPGDNGTIQTWTTAAFAPGEWNHLSVVMTTSDPNAMTYSNISAYLNGVLIGSGSHTFPWFLTRATSVGNHQYGDWTDFDGLIYEPRISLGTLAVSEFTIKPGLRTMSAVSGQSDGEAVSLPVTIANTSGTAYSVTGVAYSGADAAAFSGTPTLPLVIPAGGSSEMSVGFTPSHGGGTYTATLTLTTNDPNNPTMVVTLTVVVAGADANLIRVTATNLVSPTRMRIDFEGKANTVYQVKSSADLLQQIFTGAVTVAVDGLTTNDTGGGRGVGFVEFDITVPGRMFYQIQQP